jgi:hypothetical protein
MDIQYIPFNLSKVTIESEKNESSGHKVFYFSIPYAGIEKAYVTRRFWDSFLVAYRVSKNIFDLFSEEEILMRVQATVIKDSGSDYYVLVERDESGTYLLGFNSEANINPADQAIKTASDLSGGEFSYDYGIIESTEVFSKRGRPSRQNMFKNGKISFSLSHRHKMSIDGVGVKKSYFIGLVCVKTGISVFPYSSLFRRLADTENTKDHRLVLDAVKIRLEKAEKTQASLDELFRLVTILDKAGVGAISEQVLHHFNNPLSQLGLINFASAEKYYRQKLAIDASVLDLILVAGSVAARLCGRNADLLQRYIMSLVKIEYDLENIDWSSDIGMDLDLPAFIIPDIAATLENTRDDAEEDEDEPSEEQNLKEVI